VKRIKRNFKRLKKVYQMRMPAQGDADGEQRGQKLRRERRLGDLPGGKNL